MNMREDELWKELLRKLKHPLTPEAEQRQQKAERSFIEQKLNKVFGGTPTGGAAPLEVRNNWDKNGNIYQTDMNGKRIPSTTNYLEKFANKAKATSVNVSNWINETNPSHPSYKQKTNGILAMSTFPFAGEASIARAVVPKLASSTGRKIAQGIAKGISGGVISGGIEGLGRGMIEGKNPVKTAAQDAVAGAALGGVGGAIGKGLGKIANKMQMDTYASKIKQGDGTLKKLTSDERKKYFELSKKYYRDYEQGVTTNADKIGDVKLSSGAITETNIQNPQYSKNVIDLSKNIRNAKYIGPEQEAHPHKKYDIKQFHRLAGKDVDYLIAENNKGNKYFYKMVDPNQKSGPKPEGQNLPMNIIPQSDKTFNPTEDFFEWLKRKRGIK